MMTVPDANQFVMKYVTSQSLRRHMASVGKAMAYYAKIFGEDQIKWEVTGILHDFDWEIHPDANRHPMQGSPILRETGVDEEIIRAIQSHANYTGVARESLMEKTLFACDELTGLITACAMVKPSKSVRDVSLDTVKSKWGSSKFAAGVNRQDIVDGAKDLRVELDEHIQNVLTAMQESAVELGLEGKN